MKFLRFLKSGFEWMKMGKKKKKEDEDGEEDELEKEKMMKIWVEEWC